VLAHRSNVLHGLPRLAALFFIIVFIVPRAFPVANEQAGVVVFEAEDFFSNTPRGEHQWEVRASASGFSGSGYIEATPDIGTNLNVTWASTSPELQYQVNLLSNATYRVWIRGNAPDTAGNSLHAGLNGTTNTAGQMTLGEVFNSWIWTNITTAGNVATISGSPGTHTFHLWMREDGMRIDRIALTRAATFQPRTGNAWHIPINVQPAGVKMRSPFSMIFSNTAVTIYSGNQFQGDGNAANQLATGSTIYYKRSTDSEWSSVAMTFHSESGNDKFFSGTIPAGSFNAGDVVQYYLRIPYSDRLPTFVHGNNTTRITTEIEAEARANPFTFTVRAIDPPLHPSPEDWRDINIYQIFTDRFNDGNPSNNTLSPSTYEPSNSRRIHGGDFKGIQDKLDYIKALGANAIWISPIVLNVGHSSYHGYGAHDFYQLAPQWGTLIDLSNMVAAAHARGIYVILDIVCNHHGNRIDSTDSGWPNFKAPPDGYNLRWTTGVQYPPPFDSLTHFHNHGHIQTFTDPQQILGELSGLDDLKTETAHVRTNMVEIYKHWIDVADVDGFRMDTVKHVEIGFWQHFNPEIRAYAASRGKTNFFQFGEVYDGDEGKVGFYTGTKAGGPFANDSVLDFPLFFRVNDVFARATGNTKQIEDHYNAIPSWYDPAAQMRLVTFLDNHDFSRFLNSNNANNNTNRLNVALTFLYTSRGIPCLYYGTEQAFNGGGDPNNREDMFHGQFEQGPSVGDNFNMTHPLFRRVAMLNNFRRNYPALRRGSHVNLWNNPSGPGLFAYARRFQTQEVYVVFNTAGSSQTIPARPTSYSAGTQLVNLLNTNEIITVTAAQDGIPSVTLPATSAKIFVALSQFQPLDPIVVSVSPAHAAANASPNASIVLGFSKPMDTNSVQAAFSTQPTRAGTFTWNSARNTMTFTPSAPLGGTTNIVRVATNAMDNVNGKTFFAPFESFFITSGSPPADTTPPTVFLSAPTPSATVAGMLNISGTAADDFAVSKVEIRLDNNGWITASGTTSWSFSLDTRNFLNGTRTISARATDSSGNVSEISSVSVRFFNVPGEYVQRISAGNPSHVVDCDSNEWLSDRAYTFGAFGYTGGATGFVGNAISGVCPSAYPLYQRERFSTSASSFEYLFDCPAGIYETTLLEAETWVNGPNQRVFDVYIESEHMLANFDIYAAAGGQNIAVTLVFTNAVRDAQLEIHFFPRIDNARASGIQVRRIGDLDTDGDGIPDWWMLGHFDHPTSQDDGSHADDDPDGDGQTNLQEFLADTNPLDPNSVFQITEIVIIGNDVRVSWTTRATRSYRLQRRDILSGEDWANVGDIVSGTGGIVSLTDFDAAATAPQRIYRVQIE
jgi:glycosidase